MEIIGIIIVIWIFGAIIAGIVKSYRQKIRDQIAHDILDSIDLQIEKKYIINLNKNLNFVKTDNIDIICPACNGILVTRHSAHGTFLGCSNYPRCHFTKNKSIWDITNKRKTN